MNRATLSTAGKDYEIAKRTTEVIRLAKEERLSLREIATRLNVSRETVRLDYWRAMDELTEERQAMGKAVLQDHLQLIEQRIEALYERVNCRDAEFYDPKDEASLQRWMNDRAKLLNLYPQADVTGTVRHEHYVMQFDTRVHSEDDDTIAGSARPVDTPMLDNGQDDE